MKEYITPEITTIPIDNTISLVLCSDNDGHHHHHHSPEYDEEEESSSPFKLIIEYVRYNNNFNTFIGRYRIQSLDI